MTPDDIQFDVVVPVFNSETTLERALRSVLSQTYGLFHLYVVIDGGTDGSADVAQRVLREHPNVRILEQDNAGVAAARNRGVREGTNPFIAFLDADDEWMPNHLETLAGLIRLTPDSGLFATAYRFCASGKGDIDVVHAGKKVQDRFLFFKASLSKRPPLWIGALAVSRACFDDVRGFWTPPDEQQCEDLDFLMRVACRYSIAYAAKVTSVYRWNPQAGSGTRYRPWGEPHIWQRGMELLRQRSVPRGMLNDFDRFVVRWGLHTVGAQILHNKRREALSLLFQCRPHHVEALRKCYWLAMLCLPSGVACLVTNKLRDA